MQFNADSGDIISIYATELRLAALNAGLPWREMWIGTEVNADILICRLPGLEGVYTTGLEALQAPDLAVLANEKIEQLAAQAAAAEYLYALAND
jgi:hypothetical protein